MGRTKDDLRSDVVIGWTRDERKIMRKQIIRCVEKDREQAFFERTWRRKARTTELNIFIRNRGGGQRVYSQLFIIRENIKSSLLSSLVHPEPAISLTLSATH
jgi:hypothetical protein